MCDFSSGICVIRSLSVAFAVIVFVNIYSYKNIDFMS